MRGCDSTLIVYEYIEVTWELPCWCTLQEGKGRRKPNSNWQDQDSSSDKSFNTVFGSETSALMKCWGHVHRAHGHSLNKIKSKKFTADYKKKHRNNFSQVNAVSCCCTGKRHSCGCGCFTDAFIETALKNVLCAISQCGNNAGPLETVLMVNNLHVLAKYTPSHIILDVSCTHWHVR